MSKAYSIAQARNQLSRLVHEAEDGEEVRLTRRGTPVAVVLSIQEYERLQQRPRPTAWTAVQELREGLAAYELEDWDDPFSQVRSKEPGREPS